MTDAKNAAWVYAIRDLSENERLVLEKCSAESAEELFQVSLGRIPHFLAGAAWQQEQDAKIAEARVEELQVALGFSDECFLDMEKLFLAESERVSALERQCDAQQKRILRDAEERDRLHEALERTQARICSDICNKYHCVDECKLAVFTLSRQEKLVGSAISGVKPLTQDGTNQSAQARTVTMSIDEWNAQVDAEKASQCGSCDSGVRHPDSRCGNVKQSSNKDD